MSTLPPHTLTFPSHLVGWASQDPDICVCGCQYGACIPQRSYICQKNDPVPASEKGALITFSLNGKCGFSVKSALEKRYAGLDGRDDYMFAGFRSAVSIRFEVSEPVSAGSIQMFTVICNAVEGV